MKIKFKIFLSIFIVFFVCIVFVFLPIDKIYSANTPSLEVVYPVLQSGATITAQSDFAQYLKYIFDLSMMVGFVAIFLSLTWAGILFFLSPAIPSALTNARDRVAGAISGLMILVLLYLIITTINPYLSFFHITKLDSPDIKPLETKTAGINFSNFNNCASGSKTYTNSIPDLGPLKNKINSVSITQSQQQSYIAIIYDITNYWGKCQYINPNVKCQPVSPFAASASIYKYDFYPSGGSVSLFRNSFFTKDGGWLTLNSSTIGKMYIQKLQYLKFVDPSKKTRDNPEGCTVPADQLDCVHWDKKSLECDGWACPNAGKENISSIKIDGNYLVLLIYYDPSDTKNGPWSYCQAFPTIQDANREGPQQIKWDAIRNHGQDPNFIMIIPVLNK